MRNLGIPGKRLAANLSSAKHNYSKRAETRFKGYDLAKKQTVNLSIMIELKNRKKFPYIVKKYNSSGVVKCSIST